MRIKKSNLPSIIVITCLVIAGLFFGFLFLTSGNNTTTPNTEVVSIEGDKQIIDITAKGGYFPLTVEAKGNIETTLRVITNNTFDCSTALAIPSLKVRRNLPPTGKTEISLGTPRPGQEINGTCSMGMYRFKIRFI